MNTFYIHVSINLETNELWCINGIHVYLLTQYVNFSTSTIYAEAQAELGSSTSRPSVKGARFAHMSSFHSKNRRGTNLLLFVPRLAPLSFMYV